MTNEYTVTLDAGKKKYSNKKPLHSMDEAVEWAEDVISECCKFVSLSITRNPGNVEIVALLDAGNACTFGIGNDDPDKPAAEEFASIAL